MCYSPDFVFFLHPCAEQHEKAQWIGECLKIDCFGSQLWNHDEVLNKLQSWIRPQSWPKKKKKRRLNPWSSSASIKIRFEFPDIECSFLSLLQTQSSFKVLSSGIDILSRDFSCYIFIPPLFIITSMTLSKITVNFHGKKSNILANDLCL